MSKRISKLFFRSSSNFCSVLSRRFVKLNNEIFACFLQSDYPDNEYLYERRLHVQKNKCMKFISTVTEQTKMYDRFYSIMLDYSQLRHRVPDHTIFEICRHELIAIRQAINNILQNMIYFTVNDERNIEILREKIDRFEDIYQNVLRVTARDPIAFVLFIDSLKMFGRTK